MREHDDVMCEPEPMALTVQPVSETLFDDVQTIFGTTGQAARCQCQGYRMGWHARHSDDVRGRRELLRDQVIEGHGLVAHFLAECLARKGRPPAGTLRLAVQVLAGHDHGHVSLRPAAGRLLNLDVEDDQAAAVLAEAVGKSADNRLPYVLLAYAAAAGEANLRSRNLGWQFNPGFAVQWLDTLESLGYPLSEVESQLRTYWSAPLEDTEDLPDEDEDTATDAT